MQNEHHFYHQSPRRNAYRAEIASQQAVAATLPAAPSGEKAYHQACERLSQLLPRTEYLHFITEEVYGSWAEMIQVVDAEIIRLECEADPLREFRTVETGADFSPEMDTDLYA